MFDDEDIREHCCNPLGLVHIFRLAEISNANRTVFSMRKAIGELQHLEKNLFVFHDRYCHYNILGYFLSLRWFYPNRAKKLKLDSIRFLQQLQRCEVLFPIQNYILLTLVNGINFQLQDYYLHSSQIVIQALKWIIFN